MPSRQLHTNNIVAFFMNIIIVGCGKVGQALAEQLNEEGNNITVIDIDPTNLKNLANSADVLCVVGNGAAHSVQKEAGIQNADLLIAVTDSDELNLLCCTVAKRGGKCQTIAKVKNKIAETVATTDIDKLFI